MLIIYWSNLFILLSVPTHQLVISSKSTTLVEAVEHEINAHILNIIFHLWSVLDIHADGFTDIQCVYQLPNPIFELG
jgi:hypothetical protein